MQQSAIVYNLTVDEFHTYFVGQAGTLVHNTKTKSVVGLPRSGTAATKTDAYHNFPDIIDNYSKDAKRFMIETKGRGGEVNRMSELLQVEGSLNGKSGIFEWIIDQGEVTHRLFIPNGTISGIPNRQVYK